MNIFVTLGDIVGLSLTLFLIIVGISSGGMVWIKKKWGSK